MWHGNKRLVVQIDYGLGAGGLIERGMAAARERTRAIDKQRPFSIKGHGWRNARRCASSSPLVVAASARRDPRDPRRS